VLNGSFERAGTGDLPEAWSYWGSAGTTVARDGAYALYGQYSARVSATSPSDAGLCQVAFTDSPTVIERLTLSASLRLTDVVSTSGGGAAIGVEYLDPSTGLVLKQEYGNFYAGTGTVRPALALKDLPLAGCKYRVVLRLYQATGTVWFDGVQLEIAYAPGAYTPLHTLSPFNSLENTGFDAGGAITPWSDGSSDFTIGWVNQQLRALHPGRHGQTDERDRDGRGETLPRLLRLRRPLAVRRVDPDPVGDHRVDPPGPGGRPAGGGRHRPRHPGPVALFKCRWTLPRRVWRLMAVRESRNPVGVVWVLQVPAGSKVRRPACRSADESAQIR